MSVEFLEEIGSIDPNFIQENINNFHIMDFNADGKLDMIYYGFAGAESNKTIFFINKKGTYKKILSIYGDIINMNREAIYLPVSFQLMDYPCCENTTYSLKTYVSNTKNGTFKFDCISNINYVEKTEFTADFENNPIPFEVLNEGYKLRSSPTIDNNVVSTYKKGSLGICLATKEDADRVWWLVIMFNNIEPTTTILDEGNNKGKYYSIGWMSSRFLKEVNTLNPVR